MPIQLRDIEYFAAIAEHGQVQKAAASLGLSQPALSKSLRRLELGIGSTLCNRTPKGIDITAVGHVLLRHVRRLRLATNDVLREAMELGAGAVGNLRIGAGPDLAVDLVPSVCAALLHAAPRVTLEVTVGTADVLLPALSRGELDLTVTASSPVDHADLVAEQILGEEYLVYCSVKHRLARKKSVKLADLAAERWVLAVSSGSLQQKDLHRLFEAEDLTAPNVAVESNSIPFRARLMAHTDLLGFLPRRAFHGRARHAGLAELSVKGLSYARQVSVWHRRDAYLSPTALRFVAMLRESTRAAKTMRARKKNSETQDPIRDNRSAPP